MQLYTVKYEWPNEPARQWEGVTRQEVETIKKNIGQVLSGMGYAETARGTWLMGAGRRIYLRVSGYNEHQCVSELAREEATCGINQPPGKCVEPESSLSAGTPSTLSEESPGSGAKRPYSRGAHLKNRRAMHRKMLLRHRRGF